MISGSTDRRIPLLSVQRHHASRDLSGIYTFKRNAAFYSNYHDDLALPKFPLTNTTRTAAYLLREISVWYLVFQILQVRTLQSRRTILPF